MPAGRTLGTRRQLLLEPLEDRRLLSADSLADSSPAALVSLPSTSGIDAPAAMISADASLVASPAVMPTDQINVYRHGAVVATYLPPADTDVDRGTTLRTALAEAQPGDEIVLGAYTFDMGGTEHVDWPAHVTVTGAGKEATKVTSSCPQSLDGDATFTLRNETVLQNLWLEGSLMNGLYQPLVGMQATPTEAVTTYLRNVKMTGDSDGLFLWTAHTDQYTIYAYDCDIHTRYDAVALLGSGLNYQSVYLYSCNLSVGQPDPIPAHMSNVINLQSGFVGLYDCTLTATGDPASQQIYGAWCYNQGTMEIVNSTFNVSSPAGQTYDLIAAVPGHMAVIGGQGSGEGGSYTSRYGNETYTTAAPATVVDRGIFYNNSKFDDYNPSANFGDAAAVASDKTPLLPGDGVATAGSLSSYAKGLNGVFVDLAGIHGLVTADDFLFKVGHTSSPATWTEAPAPIAVVMMGGQGVGGTDRVEILWNAGDIKNTWLSVQVLPNSDTGLAELDEFYWANLIGDSNLNYVTNANDALQAINNSGATGSAAITNTRDFNRDGTVNPTDALTAINSQSLLVRLNLEIEAFPAAVKAGTAATPANTAAVDDSASGGAAASPQALHLPKLSKPTQSGTRHKAVTVFVTQSVPAAPAPLPQRSEPRAMEEAPRHRSLVAAAIAHVEDAATELDDALLETLSANWAMKPASRRA